MNKSSTNSQKHPYLRGITFWHKNQFWNTPFYSQKSKDYYNTWLEELRVNERSLIRL